MPLINFYRHISLVTFRQSILHHSPADVIIYVLFGKKVATIVNGWYSFKDQSACYGLKGDLSPVTGWQKLFFSYKFFLIVGSRCNHYLVVMWWRTHWSWWDKCWWHQLFRCCELYMCEWGSCRRWCELCRCGSGWNMSYGRTTIVICPLGDVSLGLNWTHSPSLFAWWALLWTPQLRCCGLSPGWSEERCEGGSWLPASVHLSWAVVPLHWTPK